MVSDTYLWAPGQNMIELDPKHSGKLAGLTNQIQLLHYLIVSTTTGDVVFYGTPSVTK